MSTPPKSQRLAEKVAIVTGASSGLGRAIALEFAANGAGLVVCSDIRPDARGGWGASEAEIQTHALICQRYGEGKAVYIKTDVTIAEDLERAVKEAVKYGGRLDVYGLGHGLPLGYSKLICWSCLSVCVTTPALEAPSLQGKYTRCQRRHGILQCNWERPNASCPSRLIS